MTKRTNGIAMSISDTLDALRQSRTAVETATYLDLSSGTVLYSSTAVVQPQERLDALCVTAQSIFDHAPRDSADAVSFGPTEALVFCRSPRSETEIVGLVCAPDVDLSDVIEATHRAIREAGT